MINFSLFLSCMWLANVHTRRWGSVGSAIFMLLICVWVIGNVFILRFLCRTLVSCLSVSWVSHTNCDVLQYTESKCKSEDPMSTLLHLGHPFFPCSSFHPVCDLLCSDTGLNEGTNVNLILNINRLISYWLFLVIKNKSCDTFFHTLQLILDSIHFGDHCFRTVVSKILPVFINAALLNTATWFVYVLSLAAFVLQWQSCAAATEMVWSSKPKLCTVWLFTEKGGHLWFRKWMELEGYQMFSIQYALICSVRWGQYEV